MEYKQNSRAGKVYDNVDGEKEKVKSHIQLHPDRIQKGKYLPK
jgi:hypothetical protein